MGDIVGEVDKRSARGDEIIEEEDELFVGAVEEGGLSTSPDANAVLWRRW